MQSVKIWHNPRCTKSRESLQIAEENNHQCEVVKYLDTKPDANEIKQTLQMIGCSARELMRTTENLYKELNLKDEMNEDKLIEAMAEHSKLIQRPVLFKNGKAILGRPASKIAEFLNS